MIRGIQALALFMTLQCFSLLNTSLAGDDIHLWNTLTLSHSINENWRLHFGTDQKFVDDISKHGIRTVFTGTSYKAANNLFFGFEIRHHEKKSGGQWLEENRFAPFMIWKNTFDSLSLTFRERTELRTREGNENWVSRNLLKLAVVSGTASPYVSNELFYDLTAATFTENRLSIGLDLAVFKNLNTSLYYLYKSNEKDRGWSVTNVFGTSLTLHP
ncbi:hypothetical protein CHL67_01160 [Prosthecochloris sp. GSB1]|uniref:DUF2490 domain-containing protein n=1 Tax=Prosthecochloris sp. GSB1 TaxID=281093 RepID=UPI000B8CD9AB|nr:DUF2490 domain-containing protein [Prosthecochloris sp. GSB1]ASQ89712.1 hypothetical protein CHL67_01160 [Prosthecochloris sp. GSB1]